MLLGRAARNMNYGFSGGAGESAGGAGESAGGAGSGAGVAGSGAGADAGGSEPVAAGGMLSDGGTAAGGTASGVSGAGALKPDCGAPGAGARGDTELSGSDEGKSPNPAEPAPMVLTADGLASMSLRFSGRYHRQASAQVKIHKRTAIAVMRVKISPALTPNAL